MTACRRAWFIGQRAEEKIVPALNPFAKMGLKRRRPGEAHRDTPTPHGPSSRPSAARLGSLAMGRSRRRRSLPGSGSRERNTYLARSTRLTTAPKIDPTAFGWCTPRPARKLGGRLFDERKASPPSELMPKLDAIKARRMRGPALRRDPPPHRSPLPPPLLLPPRASPHYLRSGGRAVARATHPRSFLLRRRCTAGFPQGRPPPRPKAKLGAAGRGPAGSCRRPQKSTRAINWTRVPRSGGG